MGKESICNAGDTGDMGSIPGSGRAPAGRHGNPVQYSCLENPHGQRSLAGYGLWDHKELDKETGHPVLFSIMAVSVSVGCRWVSFSSHPLQHSLFVGFLMMLF